jgi:hypothetical protein
MPEIYIQMVAINPCLHPPDYSLADLAGYPDNFYSGFHWTGNCRAVCGKQDGPNKNGIMPEIKKSVKIDNICKKNIIFAPL